jgi:hypothetical protein
MNQNTAILPILAVLSVAALIGGFAIQAAEAQMIPRGIRIGQDGFSIGTDQVQIGVGPSGVIIDSPLFSTQR